MTSRQGEVVDSRSLIFGREMGEQNWRMNDTECKDMGWMSSLLCVGAGEISK